MSNEKPSIGSLWQEKSTHEVYRVISVFELIKYQNVKHGNGFRFCYFASHWHEDFTPMNNDLPLTGSYWQDKKTKKVYRVTSILDRAESSHGADAIDFQDTESGKGYVRFCSVASDWHNDFTLMNEPPPPSIGSHWQHTDTRKVYRVINIFKGARSLHGAELIGYLDTESGECYVRFTREWDEYFTLVVFGKE